MKTLKQISLLLMLACCGLITNAQLPNCGINANWGYTINPNHVHEFHDSSTVTAGTGWQITAHYWNFGDSVNNVSNLLNPTHQFSHPGHFTVCEYVVGTANGGAVTCIDTFCHEVSNCDGMVQASFIYQAQGNGVVVYTGTGSSNYPPLSYSWTFQNGTPSTSHTATTTVQYTTPGTNQTCLIVTDANGCQADNCQNVPITSSACGLANANFSSTVSGNTVALASTSTGTTNNTLYQYWLDGQPLTNPNPNTGFTVSNVTYGTHTFCLYLYGNTNTFCDSTCKTVTITSCGISAGFQATVAGNVATVYQTTNPTGVHSFWNLGDGSAQVSDTSAHFTHTFPTNANTIVYHVCHYVYMPGIACVDSLCESITVQGSSNCTGNAQITSTLNPNGGTNLSVTYSSSAIASYFWSTGATTADIIVTTGGNYCVTVTGTNGCTAAACYTVTAVCNVSAAWTSTNLANDSVHFISADVNTSHHHNWNFGDGTTASGDFFPTHHYAHDGTYHVCLYVYTTQAGCIDSLCQNVTVVTTNPCSSTLTANWAYGVLGHDSVRFEAADTNTIAHHYWNFGDGTTASDMHVTHVYANPGTYHVCLYVYIPGQSCVDSFCQNVSVTACTVSAGYQYAVHNNTVTFYPVNNPSGTHSYWVFGDGVTVNDTILGTHYINHTFPTHANNTTYHVCHYVYVPGTSCVDSVCQYVVVPGTNNCTTSVHLTTTVNPNGGYSVHAVSTTGVAFSSYHWSTGATTSDILVSGPGVYCVTVADANGCTASGCDTVANTCSVTAAFQYVVHTTWVSFYSAANNVPVHAYWNFGDGTTSTDSSAGFTHTFPVSVNTITYNVCHYIIVPNSNCTASVCQNVTVPGTGTNCGVASFQTNVANGAIHAYSNSTGVDSTTHYYWNISNNGNLVQTHSGLDNFIVSQTLPAGTYLVCLYIYANGSTVFCDSACQNVTIVSVNPCANLDASFTQTYLSTGGIQFNGVTGSNTVSDYWTFGDGTTSTNHDPIHTYYHSGLYTVCHYVEIPGSNCVDSSCHSVQASGSNPCTGFSVHINNATNSNGAHGLEATASGGTTATYFYYWSTGATTHAIYPTAAGIYCVTAYDNNQCSAVACDSFTTTTSPCHALYSYVYVNCNTVHFTNASSGSYTNQYWSFGDGTSSSSFDPTHTFPAGTWTVQLTIYSSGGSCQDTYYQVITIQPCGGTNDTICGTIFNDANGNGVQDNGEHAVDNGYVIAGNTTYAHPDSNGHYMLIVPAGTYTIYYCAPTGYSFTMPVGTVNPNLQGTCASYTVTTNGTNNCGFDFGIQNNTVEICGTVYYDANNNHTQDLNSESGIANVEVHITASNGTVYTAHTDQNGHYCATVPAGVYTITITSGIYQGGSIYPQVITLTTTNGVNYYHNDFGIYTQPGACDLAINITPHTTVTAGYAAWYDIEVCNVGASVSNGTVNLFFDPALSFNYASPAQTSANNSTHTVTWTVSNLMPGSCEHYWADFNALTTVTVGQHVFMLANVTTTGCNESNFNNNVDTVHQEATASWDPNNKLVLPIGQGVEGRISGDQELTYTVNFQNTGNANAVNVVVRDLIDDDLNLETFRMIGASHPYTMQFAGREAIWKFSAIMLPDSNTNEPASHGYVTFAITPNVGLAQGTQLTNSANIYFDYNAGVVTNTTLNTIDYTLSVNDIENGKTTITLMPNPFKDFTTIKIDGDNASYELRVFDMLGQLIRKDVTGNNIFTIQRETLAAGVYMYEVVKGNKVIGKGKMVAE